MSRSHRVYDAHLPCLAPRLEASIAAALDHPHDHFRCGWHCRRSGPPSASLQPAIIGAELRRRGWNDRRARRTVDRLGHWYNDLPDREMKILYKRAARHHAKQLITLERWDEVGRDQRTCCACGW